MGKLTFIAGVAAGYILGAKAGQKRYEQIRGRANQLWSSDPVQPASTPSRTSSRSRPRSWPPSSATSRRAPVPPR